MCLIEQIIKIGNSQHRDRPRFHVEHCVCVWGGGGAGGYFMLLF